MEKVGDKNEFYVNFVPNNGNNHSLTHEEYVEENEKKFNEARIGAINTRLFLLKDMLISEGKNPDDYDLEAIILGFCAEFRLKPEYMYYKVNNGAIVKIKHEDFLLYRLDVKTNTWILDPEMYAEISTGSLRANRIQFEDKYSFGDQMDLKGGVKL